jgi:2-dehydro-3-deoxy-D-arabinonate dehydratase
VKIAKKESFAKVAEKSGSSGQPCRAVGWLLFSALIDRILILKGEAIRGGRILMKLYRSRSGIFAEQRELVYAINAFSWDVLVTREDLLTHLGQLIQGTKPVEGLPQDLLPPIGNQEVWAAGVTYYRSCTARMEEAKGSGGGDFYDRVYNATRPELFFKATAHRVVGHGAKVAIRQDASWSVPEPELTLFVTPGGKIAGYTIGNDMSSRDIEGENPLYLPQAKVYDRSCALGPCLLVCEEPLPITTEIALEIRRGSETTFSGSTTLKEMKRKPEELVEYLYRSSSFPQGCFLLTGTGVVPSDSFTLRPDDEIRITIPPVGTLVNLVG